jgi:hypothetical protein
VVIKQTGGHFFIAAQDSIIIDKAGYLQLLVYLLKIGFIDSEDLNEIVGEVGLGEL